MRILKQFEKVICIFSTWANHSKGRVSGKKIEKSLPRSFSFCSSPIFLESLRENFFFQRKKFRDSFFFSSKFRKIFSDHRNKNSESVLWKIFNCQLKNFFRKKGPFRLLVLKKNACSFHILGNHYWMKLFIFYSLMFIWKETKNNFPFVSWFHDCPFDFQNVCSLWLHQIILLV